MNSSGPQVQEVSGDEESTQADKLSMLHALQRDQEAKLRMLRSQQEAQQKFQEQQLARLKEMQKQKAELEEQLAQQLKLQELRAQRDRLTEELQQQQQLRQLAEMQQKRDMAVARQRHLQSKLQDHQNQIQRLSSLGDALALNSGNGSDDDAMYRID